MSSNSNACQGLQSCLDPLITKPDLSFSWSQIPHVENQENRFCQNNVSGEKSSFLQALRNTSYNFRQITNDSEQVYMHPLTKLSTFSLSSRSLEMCTETLGSETGSSIDPSLAEYSNIVLERQSSNRMKQPKTREFCSKIKESSRFPPPLSSISGSNGVKVQAHREGDRLVITASTSSASRISFKAERENERLRLYLLQHDYRHGEDELAENMKEEREKFECKIGGEELSISRCNGNRSESKKLPSLPVCVASS